MDDIDRIRAFSRFYTQWLGVLGRSYLGSGLGLTEVRLLHDLDGTAPIRARDLAQGLALDEGYVSRALSGFARRGWIRRLDDGPDRRVRAVTLTESGKALVARLRADSRAAIAAALPPARLAGVACALSQAQSLMAPSSPDLTPLRPGDAGWVIARHAEHYAANDGFDATFEALVARIVADFLAGHDPARERGWIARAGERRLGSIFCVAETPEVAKLRLFFIEADARGTGLAQRMLEDCLGFARSAGYGHMRLWTHESHRAAGRLYARNGFALTAARPVRTYGQDLVEQVWERPL
ncbi:MAG: bifunctional helix-turn-helix transcriptional regulator/GNAT family N-acetyltransferase [Gemmobacter sp.]